MLRGFLKSQVIAVKKGGITAFLLKTGMLLSLPLALLILLAVRILRPLVLLRFGPLPSTRIGHLAINTEIYLCNRDRKPKRWRIVDIFYHVHPVSNRQLAKMINRKLCVCGLIKPLDWLNKRIPKGEFHIIPFSETRDIHGLFNQIPPHLVFTKNEEDIGKKKLQELGIRNGSPFVCIYGRDAVYLDKMFPGQYWHYHSYRDMQINNFLKVAEELAKRGYFVLRMGHLVKEELKTDNPKIIDYAAKHRTDFMDIYLSAKCAFYLGIPGGIASLPMIFRRPIAFVNLIPIAYIHGWGRNYITITKKLRWCNNGSYMSLNEIVLSGAGRFLTKQQYEDFGLEVIENSPEEIKQLAIEMDERLKGRWQNSEEDEALQKKFWSYFKPGDLNRVFLSRVGNDFLRQNRDWLGI